MESIFVFEKERIICLDIKNLFSERGFNVVFGDTVRDLMAKGTKPALVIMDMLSYKKLKAQDSDVFADNRFDNSPMIVSYSGKENENEYLGNHLSIIGKVNKPYDPCQLVDIYRAYIIRQYLV